jgi:hypothetical protein
MAVGHLSEKCQMKNVHCQNIKLIKIFEYLLLYPSFCIPLISYVFLLLIWCFDNGHLFIRHLFRHKWHSPKYFFQVRLQSLYLQINNNFVEKMAQIGIDRDEYLLLFALLFTNTGFFLFNTKSKDNIYDF